MEASKSISHLSTLPPAELGLKVLTSCTLSPSAEIMAVTVRSSSNLILLMPSKIFFRKGWTRRGSLVSDKISKSSSFDKK